MTTMPVSWADIPADDDGTDPEMFKTLDVKEGDRENESDEPQRLIKDLHPADSEAKVKVDASLPEHLQSKAVATFDELNLPSELLKGVYEAKFTKPSNIQAQTLPHIMKGTNVIGQAQTGSGKTACFALGMLAKVDVSKAVPQALCLGPTRELVFQIRNHTQMLGKHLLGVTDIVLVPAVTKKEKVHSHLVFGTPGKVSDLVKRKMLALKDIRVFVLDEADNMIEGQLGEKTKQIASKLPETTQRLLFSATFDSARVKDFAKSLVREPVARIMVKRADLTLDGIKQYSVRCTSPEAKFQVIDDIFSTLTIGQTLIFVQKKKEGHRLCEELRAKKHTVAVLTGDLEAADRDRVMSDFRKGVTKVLIATNVLARGIDILQVTLVINYDIPETREGRGDCETYLHRSGRTARFGRKGVTLNFVGDQRAYNLLCEIVTHWKIESAMQELDPDTLDEVLEKALKEL